jgi:hypothetical protein
VLSATVLLGLAAPALGMRLGSERRGQRAHHLDGAGGVRPGRRRLRARAPTARWSWRST